MCGSLGRWIPAEAELPRRLALRQATLGHAAESFEAVALPVAKRGLGLPPERHGLGERSRGIPALRMRAKSPSVVRRGME